MTDSDKTNQDPAILKDLPVPLARDEARKAARAAALAAFDTAGATNSDQPPQGNVVPLRPTQANPLPEGKQIMTTSLPGTNKRKSYAIAASIAALTVAVPGALWLMQDRAMRPMSAPANPAEIAELLRKQNAQRTAAGGEPRRVQTIEVDATGRVGSGDKQAAEQKAAADAKPVAKLATAPPPPPQSAPLPPVASLPVGPLRPDMAQPRQSTVGQDQQFRFGASTKFDDAAASAPAKVKPVPGMIVGNLPADEARARIAELKSELETTTARKGGFLPPEAVDQRRMQITQEIASLERRVQPAAEMSRDRFANAEPFPFKSVAEAPVSTFSVDVDTASYSLVRRSLNAGRLPHRDAVRVEELINYFSYAYPRPASATTPFQTTVSVVPAPWNADNRLVHIALKGYEIAAAERPRANLVFLVDISGSMAPQDRLPLLKGAFSMLVDQLKPDDTVAIVTYANDTATKLTPTKVSDKARILEAIDQLQAAGGTHGAGGLQRAYALAEAGLDKAAVNRIILATDGDFNIGITDRSELTRYVEGKRKTGIYLSVLGVGMGNHNDRLMQALAQNGNGVAAYIDTLNEARKVLVEEASASLFPIARDVKLQIEFNPAQVSAYRQIGYETRALRREDFNNDKVDAGDVGSGHAVTAIYEIVPVGAKQSVDELRYQQAAPKVASPPASTGAASGEIAFLKLRYKLQGEEESRLLTTAIRQETPLVPGLVPQDVRFSIAVAAFGQLLKGSPHLAAYSYDEVIALANGARGDDAFGLRAEFVNLVRMAKALSSRP